MELEEAMALKKKRHGAGRKGHGAGKKGHGTIMLKGAGGNTIVSRASTFTKYCKRLHER